MWEAQRSTCFLCLQRPKRHKSTFFLSISAKYFSLRRPSFCRLLSADAPRNHCLSLSFSLSLFLLLTLALSLAYPCGSKSPQNAFSLQSTTFIIHHPTFVYPVSMKVEFYVTASYGSAAPGTRPLNLLHSTLLYITQLTHHSTYSISLNLFYITQLTHKQHVSFQAAFRSVASFAHFKSTYAHTTCLFSSDTTCIHVQFNLHICMPYTIPRTHTYV